MRRLRIGLVVAAGVAAFDGWLLLRAGRRWFGGTQTREPPADRRSDPERRQTGERRSGIERRRHRNELVERIGRARERRSGADRRSSRAQRSGRDRRSPSVSS